MISIVCELDLKKSSGELARNVSSKVKGHMKRNWPLYLMGAGAIGSGIAVGQAADELEKSKEHTKAAVLRGTRAPALVATGFAIAKSADRLKKEAKSNLPNLKGKKG